MPWPSWCGMAKIERGRCVEGLAVTGAGNRVLRFIFACKYNLLCLHRRMRLEILSLRIQRAPSLFTLYQVIDQWKGDPSDFWLSGAQPESVGRL